MAHEFKISPGVYFALALMVFLLPLKWGFSVIFSALIHELGHVAAIYVCGGRILGTSLRTSGARINMDCLSPGKELICAAAGPFAGLLLVFTAPVFPRLAICALIHSAYNMLPVYPMDGGRIVRSIIELLFSHSADRVYTFFENAFLVIMFLLTVCGCLFFKLGFMPLAVVLILALRTYGRKIPCNGSEQAVQ